MIQSMTDKFRITKEWLIKYSINSIDQYEILGLSVPVSSQWMSLVEGKLISNDDKQDFEMCKNGVPQGVNKKPLKKMVLKSKSRRMSSTVNQSRQISDYTIERWKRHNKVLCS